jgi:hypothetical protein
VSFAWTNSHVLHIELLGQSAHMRLGYNPAGFRQVRISGPCYGDEARWIRQDDLACAAVEVDEVRIRSPLEMCSFLLQRKQMPLLRRKLTSPWATC